MPSPAAEEERSGVPMEVDEGVVEGAEEPPSSDEDVLGGARVSAAEATEAEAARPASACCVCMDPWTSSGTHRICCIPCGHTYGRSCLEKWLSASGNTSAKCPQCGEGFEDRHIINIYAPGNSCNGCYHMREVEAHHSKIAKFRRRYTGLAALHSSEAKSKEQSFSIVVENSVKLRAQIQSTIAANQPTDARKDVLDLLKTLSTGYELIAEKMVMKDRHYHDLVEFIEQNLNSLGGAR